MRRLIPFVLTLASAACQFPRPQSVEVIFELQEKDVSIDATFADLRLPKERLHQFEALGMLISPERAKRTLELPWVSKVEAWELTAKDGRASLHVKATATREAFEQCLTKPCEFNSDVCELLPLNRKCQTRWYQELGTPVDDAYAPTPRSTKEWTPDTKRFVLSLTRVPHPNDAYTATSKDVWGLFVDRALATRVLDTFDVLSRAEQNADAASWQQGVATLEALPPAYAGAQWLHRERLGLWHRLLRQYDARWLRAPEAKWGEPILNEGTVGNTGPRSKGPPPMLVPPPKPAPPEAWLWKARAFYELRLDGNAGWMEPELELCSARWLAGRKDYQRFCVFTGGSSSKP